METATRFSGIHSEIKWYGSKGRLAETIINLMPPHSTYVEPFAGGASVLTQKAPVQLDVFNDIDNDLVNFLLVLREEKDRLATELDTLPYSRWLYEKWAHEELPEDPFERALRWFYLNRAGVVSGNNHKSGWSYYTSDGNKAKEYHAAIARLGQFAERFRDVQIENRDARKVIQTYDGADTLFYIDAPYCGQERRYKGGWTEQDHIELADLLESIQGKCIVSYYAGELIDGLYEGWRRVEIPTRSVCRVVQAGEERPERTELLLLNWDDPQLTLWNYA